MGMTDKGLIVKRQNEVIEDLKAAATPIFQDLVPVGDIVDTSDSSTIGRIIGLISAPLSDLHEMAEEIYLAFDPEGSYGVALDNLVSYLGLTRLEDSPTFSYLVLWGDTGTHLPPYNTQVRGTNGQIFSITQGITFNEDRCAGARFVVEEPEDGKEYIIEASMDTGTYVFTVTADSASTKNSIAEALYEDILGYAGIFTAGHSEDGVTLELNDWTREFTLTSEGAFPIKIKKKSESQNVTSGAIPQPRNTLNIIATPVLGWDSVNNPVAGDTGRDRETDSELRIRFKNAKYDRAQNMGDSLFSTLSGLEGVRYVSVYENDTDVFDANYDLPPHSFKPLIQGGDINEIAKEIWRNKPIGISSEGNTEVTIIDSQGFQQEVRFDRPQPVPILITMDISVNNYFPNTGLETIRQNLTEYVANQFGIGTDVVYSRLFTPINSVRGHQVNSLLIGKDSGSMDSSNIPIEYNEISTISSADIVITIDGE